MTQQTRFLKECVREGVEMPPWHLQFLSGFQMSPSSVVVPGLPQASCSLADPTDISGPFL